MENILTCRSFFAPLKVDIIPKLGNGPPSFTRATTATVTDWENIVRQVLSGEVRFQGARRVQNLLATTSQDFNNAAWGKTSIGAAVPTVVNNTSTAPDGTATACQITFPVCTAGQSTFLRQTVSGLVNPSSFAPTIYARADVATQLFLRQGNGGAGNQVLTIGPTWTRISATVGSNAATTYNFDIGRSDLTNSGAAATVFIWGAELENVTGQSNTNPSEYVSVGVLSFPFHGVGVDGVKCFGTQNSNIAMGNNTVMQLPTSLPEIASTTLLGYLADGARTNLCLQSEDFATTWTANNSVIVTNSTIAPDGNATADKITPDATSNLHGPLQNIAKAVSPLAYSCTVWAKANGYNFLTFRIDSAAINGVYCSFNLSNGTIATAATANGAGWTAGLATIKAYPNGWYRCECQVTTASEATIRLVLLSMDVAGNPFSYVFSGDTVSGMYLWGADLEQASFASSYIPTTTVAVPRNADVLTYPSAGNVDGTQGAAYAEVTASSNVAYYLDVAGSGGGNRPVLFAQGSSLMKIFDGTTVSVGVAYTFSQTTPQKITSKWGGAAMFTYVTGNVSGSTAFDGDLNASSIAIGVGNGGSQPFGTIRNVNIFPYQIPDAILSFLTLQGITW